MKKMIASAVAVGLLAGAGMAFAGLPAGTGVNGSLHDMNKYVSGNADSMARVCVFCHTPHHAQSNSTVAAAEGNPNGLTNNDTAPLWDRPDTTLTYTPYAWVTPANTAGATGDPTAPDFTILDPLAGPSRLCMSCHDGVVAVDSHKSTRQQSGNAKVTTRANLGSDLTETHPIGFDYVQIMNWRNGRAGNVSTNGGTSVGSEIVDPNQGFATEVNIDGTEQGVYNVVTRGSKKTIKDTLFAGSIMTCASCHEVHNKENATQATWASTTVTTGATVEALPANLQGTVAPNYFLYAKEKDSLICLSCHVK